jgi:hypothetical protein
LWYPFFYELYTHVLGEKNKVTEHLAKTGVQSKTYLVA